MTEIKIEKNVPIPEGYKNSKWPFGQMKVGDSFQIPAELMGKAPSAMSYFGKRNKMKFSQRGGRVWRIK